MADLSKALKELDHCREAISALRAASGSQQMHKAWVDLLTHLERCWNKVRAARQTDSRLNGWTGIRRIEALRRQDPLLSYLVNARGANEHGIEDIAKEIPGQIQVLVFGGAAVMSSGGAVLTTASGEQCKLVPVINRGSTYAVPTTHLGSPLAGADPPTLAETGLEFYRREVEAIARLFP
jgi:hypothetical protein